MSRASQVVSPIPVVSSLATQNITVISGTLLSTVETCARDEAGAVQGISSLSSDSTARPDDRDINHDDRRG
jgi:hypothetical protein